MDSKFKDLRPIDKVVSSLMINAVATNNKSLMHDVEEAVIYLRALANKANALEEISKHFAETINTDAAQIRSINKLLNISSIAINSLNYQLEQAISDMPHSCETCRHKGLTSCPGKYSCQLTDKKPFWEWRGNLHY